MDKSELLGLIEEEYGHAYFPDFSDNDVIACAKVWREEDPDKVEQLLSAYYGGKPPKNMHNIAVDFQDYIEEWLEAAYEEYQNEE
jgi:hypothetical protein